MLFSLRIAPRLSPKCVDDVLLSFAPTVSLTVYATTCCEPSGAVAEQVPTAGDQKVPSCMCTGQILRRCSSSFSYRCDSL